MRKWIDALYLKTVFKLPVRRTALAIASVKVTVSLHYVVCSSSYMSAYAPSLFVVSVTLPSSCILLSRSHLGPVISPDDTVVSVRCLRVPPLPTVLVLHRTSFFFAPHVSRVVACLLQSFAVSRLLLSSPRVTLRRPFLMIFNQSAESFLRIQVEASLIYSYPVSTTDSSSAVLGRQQKNLPLCPTRGRHFQHVITAANRSIVPPPERPRPSM